MSYKVYKFVDESIMALPTSWEKNGKVPFGPNAINYISNGKEPPKVWKMYDVTTLDARVYNSYSSALEAEALLINQSDINSSDFEKITAPPKKRSPKKRKYLNPPPSSPVESEKSSEDGFGDLPAVPIKRFLSCHNGPDLLASALTEANIQEIQLNNKSAIQSTAKEQTITETIDSSIQISSDAESTFIFSTTPEFVGPDERIEYESDMTSIITNTSENTIVTGNVLYSFDENTLRRIIREELAAFQTREECITTTFENDHSFPLHDLNELQKFDMEFKNNSDLAQKFISYLKRRGGANVKKHLEVLNRMYSISLQELVTYTGRQGSKFALINLHHIKTLIGTIASLHDDTCTRKAAASKKKSL